MKKHHILKSLLTPFYISLIVACSQKPSDTEIFEIVKDRYHGSLILGTEYKEKGASRKVNDEKIYSYTLIINYISSGLTYGYVSGCPERHCIEDTEYITEIELLIRKDHWDKWSVANHRTIKRDKVATRWRPSSQSLKTFYGERALSVKSEFQNLVSREISCQGDVKLNGKLLSIEYMYPPCSGGFLSVLTKEKDTVKLYLDSFDDLLVNDQKVFNWPESKIFEAMDSYKDIPNDSYLSSILNKNYIFCCYKDNLGCGDGPVRRNDFFCTFFYTK